MAFKTYQKYIVAAIPLILVGLMIYYFSDIFTYVILAWVVSMLGAPLNNLLSKYIGKTAAAISTLISFALILLAIVWMFIPPIVQQARKFADIDYEQLALSFEEPLDDWSEWLVNKGLLPEDHSKEDSIKRAAKLKRDKEMQLVEIDSLIHDHGDTMSTGITIVLNVNQPPVLEEEESIYEVNKNDDFFERAKKSIIEFVNPSRITGLFGSVVGFLGNLLITFMSVLFIAFFFLKEQGLFSKMVKALVPNEFEDQSVHAIDESANLLIRYFIGIATQIIVITIYVTSVLSFLGVQNALLIGFFAALMNVVPYIGPILGAAFGVIIVVSANLDVAFYDVLLPKILKVLGVFASMQMIDNFLIQPTIFGKSVKAHPLEIFIVVLMGAKIGGVVGMILAIPSYTVLRVVAKVFLSEFKVVKRITQNM